MTRAGAPYLIYSVVTRLDMHRLNKFNGRLTSLLVIVLFAGIPILAQKENDPALLPKNSFIWNQEQRELGFLHFDEVFTGRVVSAGDHVRELPQGAPIAIYDAGGDKEAELERFISEQKVAGILVLKDGKIRLERYALGLSETGKWTSQSVAKSITSTLVGAAIKDGYIKSLDDHVSDYIPELNGSLYEQVTIHHVLSMTTGARWTETYHDNTSDLAKMYVAPIEPDMEAVVSYMRGVEAEHEPGKVWHYNTGETHLLGVLVSAATGLTLADYLSRKIWIPYGMESDATWLIGRTDHEQAGCCLQMRLRDFARYGQLVLDDGVINGESIVPDGWFEAATTRHGTVWGPMGYGYQWFTYDDGTFQALGIHGQIIHIDPSRNLVIVISSAWPEAENTIRHQIRDLFIRSLSAELDQE